MQTKLIILLTFALSMLSASAKVKLAEVFTDNMVLQCEKPLTVWGTASASERITVKIANKSAVAIADAQGHWKVSLPALKVSTDPVRFVVRGKENYIELSNVLVGEVWLAGGQSNMEYSMANHPKYKTKAQRGTDPDKLRNEYLSAHNPLIRIMRVEKQLKTDTLPSLGWQMIDTTSLKPFSAAAYFFAKALQDSLNVPVGIIASSWGGTAIETWTPAEVYKKSEIFKSYMNADTLTTTNQWVGKRFEKMIKPIIPLTLRGFIWYQGETNFILGDIEIYTEKQKMLVESWRKLWGDEKLPFYYVQISPMDYTKRFGDIHMKTWHDLPRFWDAQTRCLDVVDNVGMIVTTDLVDNLGDIHPTYKWIVGERLARLALSKTYGRKNVACESPRVEKIEATPDSITITFANTYGGLTTTNGKAPSWIWVKSIKNRYERVHSGILRNNQLIIPTKDFAKPYHLMVGYNESAHPNIVNSEGLPIIPFEFVEPSSAGNQ